MTTTLKFITDIELDELNKLLLNVLPSYEAMTLEILDGYLHAIAIGPKYLMIKQWMPGIWGEEDNDVLPPVENLKQRQCIVLLIMRHFKSIVERMAQQPPKINFMWSIHKFKGRKYDNAEGWAYGFVQGMKLCRKDWEPLLKTPQGQAWYRPIGLLGQSGFSPELKQLAETPYKRSKLAHQIPESVIAINEYWHKSVTTS